MPAGSNASQVFVPRKLSCLILLLASGTAFGAESNVGRPEAAPGPVQPATSPPPSPSATPSPSSRASAINGFRLIARAEALKAGLPFDLVDAVMKVESDYSPGRVGDVGELGLMQVRPGTAAMLGFRGAPGELSSPAVNIHYGALYLGQAWHLTKGDVCRTLMKYRAGHGQEVMSALSSTYCARARAHLLAINSPLAGLVKSADLVAAAPAEPPVGGAERSGATLPSLRHKAGPTFWHAFEARIKVANARVEAKWRARVAVR